MVGTLAYFVSLFVDFNGYQPTHEDFVPDYWDPAGPKQPQSEFDHRVNLAAALGVEGPGDLNRG